MCGGRDVRLYLGYSTVAPSRRTCATSSNLLGNGITIVASTSHSHTPYRLEESNRHVKPAFLSDYYEQCQQQNITSGIFSHTIASPSSHFRLFLHSSRNCNNIATIPSQRRCIFRRSNKYATWRGFFSKQQTQHEQNNKTPGPHYGHLRSEQRVRAPRLQY